MELDKTIRVAQGWTRKAPPGKMSAIEWQDKLDLAYTRGCSDRPQGALDVMGAT